MTPGNCNLRIVQISILAFIDKPTFALTAACWVGISSSSESVKVVNSIHKYVVCRTQPWLFWTTAVAHGVLDEPQGKRQSLLSRRNANLDECIAPLVSSGTEASAALLNVTMNADVGPRQIWRLPDYTVLCFFSDSSTGRVVNYPQRARSSSQELGFRYESYDYSQG